MYENYTSYTTCRLARQINHTHRVHCARVTLPLHLALYILNLHINLCVVTNFNCEYIHTVTYAHTYRYKSTTLTHELDLLLFCQPIDFPKPLHTPHHQS